jgi:hypothetical protein
MTLSGAVSGSGGSDERRSGLPGIAPGRRSTGDLSVAALVRLLLKTSSIAVAASNLPGPRHGGRPSGHGHAIDQTMPTHDRMDLADTGPAVHADPNRFSVTPCLQHAI